ncbi:MAG TPA: amidohydrolase family protein [Clostridiales bacterium]|nr:amidohydrolase family protein [Clostridiales bacterium]
MLKIDIHVHTRMQKGVERLGGGDYASPEELREMYKKLGIGKAVILPGINPECMNRIQSNEEAYILTVEYPELFYWFCNIDPRMGNNSPGSDLSHHINYYKKLGAKGIGEICSNLYFDDPLVENLFFHSENCNMPVLFHIGPQIGGCYGLVDEVGLPRLEKELKKFPNLHFIGHSQPFWAEISSDVNQNNRNSYPDGKVTPGRVVELMRNYPNLYGDLSAGSGYNAVSRDPEFGYTFIEEFQDKLYFGTDICDPRNDMKLSFWLDEALEKDKISKTAYEKVCFKNALKLLEN